MTPTDKKAPLWLFVLICAACLIAANLPLVGYLLMPVRIFVTTLHELGHALSCLATGGQVVGMTVVPDGQGHGGLTFTRGGSMFIIGQMGYLGAALAGCALVALSAKASRAKPTLIALGLLIAIAGVLFGFGAVGMGRGSEGSLSIVATAVIGIVLFFCGVKLQETGAQLLLMFLAVQTSLDALSDTIGLFLYSLNIGSASVMSDATNMQQATGVPALLWTLLWAGLSALMLFVTVKRTYLRAPAAQS